MTPTVPLAEEVQLLTGIAWEEYKRRNDAIESRNPRMTYDGGVLEIMTHSASHERPSWIIGRLFEELARGFGVNFASFSLTTYRREDLHKGFEGDGSYYIRNAALVRHKESIDLSVDPPPDLVIEVDISRRSLPKLPLFAAMGFPEVWRFVDGRLQILILTEGEYREANMSCHLPQVTCDQLNDLLSARRGLDDTDWLDMVQEWARTRRRNREI